ncbi:uncharacterized protein LOC126844141 isoform X2 [Adelges cooleyi]|nr:uncharacterized protein LOC126844141 isoform X2 [Adelges cooleyi]
MVAFKKYEKKIRTVECTNAVFVRYILDHLGKSLKHYRNVASYKQVVLRQYVKCLARMLSVMYMAKTLTYPWLLAVYVRLFAVTKTSYEETEKNDILYKLYGDRQLSSGLSKFIDKCRKSGYLQTEHDNSLPLSESRNQKTYSLLYELYCNDDNAPVYQFADHFDPQKIALSDLFDQFGQVLFENLPGDRNRWNETIDRFAVAENRISKAYITYSWVRDPFQYMEYHIIFADLLYTKFVYLIWHHFKTCQTLPNGGSRSYKCLNLLDNFKTIAKALDASHKFTLSLFAFLGTCKKISKKTLDVLEGEVKEELVNRLTGLAGGNDWDDVLNNVPIVHINHTADNILQYHQMLKNLNDFENLIGLIKLTLNPFSLYFITFISQFTQLETIETDSVQPRQRDSSDHLCTEYGSSKTSASNN